MPYTKCKICKKEFYVKPRHQKIGWGKYCSIKCRTKSQFSGKYVKCSYCKKNIYRIPSDFKKSSSKKFFCSKSCHCSWENENKRNLENAPNWNGGESIYRALLIKRNKHRVCSNCRIKDKRLLVVHHIDGNRKNNNINNLQWLCRNCHYLIHFYSN